MPESKIAVHPPHRSSQRLSGSDLRHSTLCVLLGVTYTFLVWPSELFLKVDGHTKNVNAVVFSPSGLVFATSSDDAAIRLWTSDGELTRNITGHSDRVVCLAFSPFGDRLASGSGNGTIRIWDVAEGIEVSRLKATDESIGAIAFDSTGERLFSVGWHSALDVWDTASGQLVDRITLPASAESCLLTSNDGAVLVGCADGVVRRCNLSTKRVDDALTGHTAGIKGMAIAADGDTVATGALDNTLRLWSLSQGRSLATLTSESQVQSLAFFGDDIFLLSGTNDGHVQIVDVKKRIQLIDVATPLSLVKSVCCGGDDHCAVGGQSSQAVLFSADELLHSRWRSRQVRE